MSVKKLLDEVETATAAVNKAREGLLKAELGHDTAHRKLRKARAALTLQKVDSSLFTAKLERELDAASNALQAVLKARTAVKQLKANLELLKLKLAAEGVRA